MSKKTLGPRIGLYPMLTALVGTKVGGRPNYLPIAHVGVVDLTAISISLGKSHYSNAGIKENESFSVNLPSTGLIKKVDYCGLVSGKNVDKSSVFEEFYGQLGTAPMIKECPLNMECRLVQIVDRPRAELFIGEVVEVYCDEEILTGDQPDMAKLDPLFFSMFGPSYWKMGPWLGQPWSIGKELKG